MFDGTFLAHGVELADGLGRDTALEAGVDADDEIVAFAAETSDEEARVSEREPSEASEGPSAGLDELVPAAAVDEHGYVSCSRAPFDARRCVGRIAMCLAVAPIELQNVAMKCYLHDGCSVLRKRGKFTNHRLIRWLLTGDAKIWLATATGKLRLIG